MLLFVWVAVLSRSLDILGVVTVCYPGRTIRSILLWIFMDKTLRSSYFKSWQVYGSNGAYRICTLYVHTVHGRLVIKGEGNIQTLDIYYGTVKS
jgi:hypothetical protein